MNLQSPQCGSLSMHQQLRTSLGCISLRLSLELLLALDVSKKNSDLYNTYIYISLPFRDSPQGHVPPGIPSVRTHDVLRLFGASYSAANFYGQLEAAFVHRRPHYCDVCSLCVGGFVFVGVCVMCVFGISNFGTAETVLCWQSKRMYVYYSKVTNGAIKLCIFSAIDEPMTNGKRNNIELIPKP